MQNRFSKFTKCPKNSKALQTWSIFMENWLIITKGSPIRGIIQGFEVWKVVRSCSEGLFFLKNFDYYALDPLRSAGLSHIYKYARESLAIKVDRSESPRLLNKFTPAVSLSISASMWQQPTEPFWKVAKEH